MKRHFTIRACTKWIVFLCPLATQGRAQAGFDPSGDYRISLTRVRRIEARLSTAIRTPNLQPAEWIIEATIPPELPIQRNIDLNVAAYGKELTEQPIEELSDLHRRVLLVRVPQPESGEPALHVTHSYTATLFKRQLVRGRPLAPVSDLDEETRKLFLRSTPTTDWDVPAFLSWLDRAGLRARKDERDLAFAYRAFRTLARDGRYQPDPPHRRPSEVCQSGKTDCGGFSLLLTAVLRANGVPSRTLWGRWAKSQDGSYGQWHVTMEFFARGIGWVPVELTGAITWKGIDIDSCFGRDGGEFIAFHVDPDLIIDTGPFGRQPVPWQQGPVWWVRGKGTTAGAALEDRWVVHDVPSKP
ncbi:MAG: transglutaminase domain-containing protein [Phycisphaerae bacterium]|nr:transglutaminase domain-containing protein [Phycisphaerae bacterium]